MTCPACDEPLTGLDPPVCLMCGWSKGMKVPDRPPPKDIRTRTRAHGSDGRVGFTDLQGYGNGPAED